MMDDSLKNVMKKRMSGAFGGLTIKIELDDSGEKEKDEAKKEDLAPPVKAKDDEMKGQPEDQEIADDDPMVDNLISERDQDGYVMQAYKGEKPKSLGGKIEQMMVAKKIAKEVKDGKA